MKFRIIQPEDQSCTPDHSHDIRQEVTEGLSYTHSRLNVNTTKTLETSSFLYALIELLSERGLVGAVRQGVLRAQGPLVET